MRLRRHHSGARAATDGAAQYGGIGEEGARELALALKVNSSLTSLGLRDNRIGEGGAREVAMALKEISVLTSLDLTRNGIGEDGAREVALALKENSTLTSLSLAVCGGGRRDAAAADECGAAE